MADNVEEHRGRRGRWLVLAAVLAIGVWFVRSRRAARADVGAGWPPPRPADAGAESQLPDDGAPRRARASTADRSERPAEGARRAPAAGAAASARPAEDRAATGSGPASVTRAAGPAGTDGASAPTSSTSAARDAAVRQPTPTAARSASGAPDPARRPSPRPRAAALTPPVPAREDLPPGAAASLPDGSAPGPEYTIKGKAGSMLFHPPGSPYFARTKAEYWFRTAEDARAAGFTEWTPRKR